MMSGTRNQFSLSRGASSTSRRTKNQIPISFAGHLGAGSMICALALAIAAPMGAQTVYYVTDLGTLPGGTNSQALAVNNSGQVVGWSSTSNSPMHAFLYNLGTMTDLGTLYGRYSAAYAINNNGQLVGESDGAAFRYSAGTMTDLGMSGTFYDGSAAYGLNDNSQVVGIYSTAGHVTWTTAFATGVDFSPSAYCAGAYAINSAGIAVGYNNNAPVAWGVGAPSLSGSGSAIAINDNGQILGSQDWTGYCWASWLDQPTRRPTGSRPFLYNNGTTTDLSPLMSGALGINNNGFIVGYTTNSSGVQHAVFYSDGVVTDLNNLIDTNSELTLVTATAINNNDSIVGYGTSPSGQQHAFLLTLFSGTAPTITSQPQAVVVSAHGTASFWVTATSLQPLSYQWLLNGTNIPGAMSSRLTITNAVPANLGAYSVVLRNQSGSVVSSNAVLSMYPFVAVPFSGAMTYWGQPASFSLQTWGSEPLAYQWLQNGAAILGATNLVLNLSSVQLTSGGLYSVIVSNAFGSATNPPAEVVVLPAGVSLALNPSVTIRGVVGYAYTIQRTTTLTDSNSWVIATNFTLSQPVQIWVDTDVNASLPANPRRYYRVLPGY